MTTQISNLKNFILMEGAGNSFAILDALKYPEDAKLSIQQRADLAKNLEVLFECKLDGLIFLEFDDKYDFIWDFYNNDGSAAEMCGNAARCVSRYFLESRQQKIVKFRTKAGLISGAFAEKQVAVTMTTPKVGRVLNLQVDGQGEISGFFLDTGVPHIVINHQIDIELGHKLRRYKEFGQAGANVTFITSQMKPDHILAQTFERGVEGFTAACGTGAVAAAFWIFQNDPNLKKCTVTMPGGELVVTNATPPLLIGPANYITELKRS